MNTGDSGSYARQLRSYLNAYWLRPENAFWMTLRSLTLSRCHANSPSIDISCGDGVFSFLHAGGEFDPSFDVFGAVTGLDRATGEHVDIFDTVVEHYEPAVVRRPDRHVDVGTDFKVSMLAKADALRFYHRLLEHDNNLPLPFDDDAFASVYCNSAYWVRNIDPFLSELRRITRPHGRIILQVKLAEMAGFTLERHRDKLGDRFLEIIGRGRLHTWPTLATLCSDPSPGHRVALSTNVYNTIGKATPEFVLSRISHHSVHSLFLTNSR